MMMDDDGSYWLMICQWPMMVILIVDIVGPSCSKEHVRAVSFVGGNAAGKHIYERAGLGPMR